MYKHVLFHKPYGVLPQFTDNSPEPRPTLASYIHIPEIYPVGRLDLDSEGLLFLTDDNWVKHRMLDPEHNHPRTYHAQVEGEVTDEAIEKLRRGLPIADYITRSCKAKRVTPEYPQRVPPIRFRADIPTSWIELTLTEGKNRQVRKMTAAVGFPTLRLIRVAIGELTLKGLSPGQHRMLTASETVQLRVGFQRKG